MNTMHIVDDLLWRDNAFTGEDSYEIDFLKVAIDVMGNVSAFRRDQKFLSLVVILVY
jgi:hypothetical protein